MYIASLWIWAQETAYLNISSVKISVPKLSFNLISYSLIQGGVCKYLLLCLW